MNPPQSNPTPINSPPEKAQAVATAVVAAVTVPPAGAELLARSTLPFRAVEHSLKGYHLDATVSPDQVVAAAAELDREGFALDTITGVDWLTESQMELSYDFFHPLTGLRAVIRSRIARENPEFPTISTVFPGAQWHERETHDFFGIRAFKIAFNHRVKGNTAISHKIPTFSIRA